jgi:DNA-binding response OmpR family regulator
LFAALRKRKAVPVIMLTARGEEADRVAGLEMGADDYVVKPFSMRELVARVRAVLRRAAAAAGEAEADSVLEAAGVHLDLSRREAEVAGRRVSLTPKEFDLLAYLMRHRGRVRSREQILAAVWGQDQYLDERTVDVHIRWLRKKIEEDPAVPCRLLTVRGIGYKFAEA